ncbi:signal peptidase I [Flammeovirga yaeyamensis]|uniref:Signal peptidase I n=1 Tax=Flammeovirga yaeyamensis TaxID=367791 RepID=A0AAX1N4B9_9BACT|nr:MULTISPECIES: DUF5684 domain-containing protein [Flammeovirga]ANQ50206.1 signal peptidase I [Flammeovirga sp. MY04]MBB3699834.1 uncharacterized membrane protein YhaH (DUF805 family) [Flammeovirga yaeyamensis]NMF36597.1 signal peptidase I [Flammeovirga yaeyamensis]QWG02356.1 signal peptidase I [Flammeovirga yaeyamensis]
MENSYGIMGTIIYIAVIVLSILAYWKLFEKAGKPGWASIIPIYNAIVLLEIVGKPWWWVLLFLIPVVNIILFIYVTHLFATSYGKDIIYTIGLLLLPFVFGVLMAFDNDTRYVGPTG